MVNGRPERDLYAFATPTLRRIERLMPRDVRMPKAGKHRREWVPAGGSLIGLTRIGLAHSYAPP